MNYPDLRILVLIRPYRMVHTLKSSDDIRLSLVKAALAKEVLAEVPDQVTSYMFDNNIIPDNAPPPYRPSTNSGVYETPYN